MMDDTLEIRIRLIERKLRLRNIQLDPPIDMSEVEAFERRRGVTLPEGYRRFITEIGNGGEGPPAYGMQPFPDVLWDDEDISKPFDFSEFWSPTDPEQDDARAAQTRHGNLRLGEDGCEMHWILIVVGPERGNVWDLFEHNVEPCRDRRDFLTWYDDWLNGRNDRSIPLKQAMSDEDFFRVYSESGRTPNTLDRDANSQWWKFWRPNDR